jgi:hypothetical protein
VAGKITPVQAEVLMPYLRFLWALADQARLALSDDLWVPARA